MAYVIPNVNALTMDWNIHMIDVLLEGWVMQKHHFYLFIFFWHVSASIKVEFNNDFIPIYIELNHFQGQALTSAEVF